MGKKKLNRITIDEDNPNKAIIHIESRIYGSLEASISVSRIDLVKDYTWYVSRKRNGLYVRTDIRINGKKKTLYLHRVITGNIEKKDVDHEDGDRLNNEDHNLRLCSHAENTRNRCSQKNSLSQYCGVSLRKGNKKWISRIGCNGKQIHLGYFTSEIEASRAYDRACIKYHGSFARTNFPISDYQ